MLSLIPCFFSAQDLMIVLLLFLFIPVLLIIYIVISLQRKKEQTTVLNQILRELQTLNNKS